MLEIPLDSTEAIFSQDVVLGTQEYRLNFRWNVRGTFWTCDISTTADEPIMVGAKLSVNYPLFARYVDSRLPKKPLYVVDTSGQGIEPTLDDLGTRVILVFDDGAA